MYDPNLDYAPWPSVATLALRCELCEHEGPGVTLQRADEESDCSAFLCGDHDACDRRFRALLERERQEQEARHRSPADEECVPW